MSMWPWTERSFTFDFPATKFPDVLERLRGTPARLEDRVRDLPGSLLTTSDGHGWTIQQNIGHLIDLGYLPRTRIDQILSGASELVGADMTNRKTHEADHNTRDIAKLLATFRTDRLSLVTRLEGLEPALWSQSAVHPRLQQPMRIVDIVHFDCEHDDYHLARIGQLIATLSPR